jgi:hypothetical protein
MELIRQQSTLRRDRDRCRGSCGTLNANDQTKLSRMVSSGVETDLEEVGSEGEGARGARAGIGEKEGQRKRRDDVWGEGPEGSSCHEIQSDDLWDEEERGERRGQGRAGRMGSHLESIGTVREFLHWKKLRTIYSASDMPPVRDKRERGDRGMR